MIRGMILGYVFLWSDLIGIGAGVLLDCPLWHFKVRPQNAECTECMTKGLNISDFNLDSEVYKLIVEQLDGAVVTDKDGRYVYVTKS